MNKSRRPNPRKPGRIRHERRYVLQRASYAAACRAAARHPLDAQDARRCGRRRAPRHWWGADLCAPDMSGSSEELYSTENRPTADGLAGLPRDYTGPVLRPALPGDLRGPILDAQNRGQPVTPPIMATPAVDPEDNAVSPKKRPRASAAFSSRPRLELLLERPVPASLVLVWPDSLVRPGHRTGIRPSSTARWIGRRSPWTASWRQPRPISFRLEP